MDTPVIGDGTTGRYEEPNEKTVTLVAEKFSRLLREYLSPKQMREVEDQSASAGCKTHDFLDANMVMDEAMTEVTGESMEMNKSDEAAENESALWNRAWDKARENNFAF